MTIDDSRIRELAEEVLAQLRDGRSEGSTDLEARVALLEAAVHRLQLRTGGLPLQPWSSWCRRRLLPPGCGLLGPSGGAGNACVLEPDKPCVGSGQCRSFGH